VGVDMAAEVSESVVNGQDDIKNRSSITMRLLQSTLPEP
jgi:hypothetical protein